MSKSLEGEDSNTQALLARQKRRSRIRGIRNAIIAIVVIWIIASAVLLGFLTWKVLSLESTIKNISGSYVSVTEYEETAVSAEPTEYGGGLINSNGDTAESNLAGLDDTIKVYLTFDDGPSNNTDRILDILDDYGIKSTFFVQGKNPDVYGDRYRRIVNEGHTLAMHTYSHVYSQIYESVESFSDDIKKIRDLIKDTTGVEPDYYRFPGGSSNNVSNGHMADFIAYLNREGITYVDWNVSSNDAVMPPLSSDTIVENVLKDVVRYKTSIVLMHDADEMDSTVEALPTIIERLQELGAIILPISGDTTLIQQVTISE